MFYEPKEGHGLSKNPFNSLVIPRPIGWISSLDSDGNVNLAPYSFFNGVSYRPPTVMFSSGQGRSRMIGLKIPYVILSKPANSCIISSLGMYAMP